MKSVKLIARLGLLSVLSVVLVGCFVVPRYVGLRADQVVIPDTFDRQAINVDNVQVAVQNCIPDGQSMFVPQQWHKQPPGSISTISSPGLRNFFMATKTQGVCVLETDGRFPVLPVEAIEFRTFFTDIPATVQHQWFRLVAKAIATSGKAELAVTMGNGATYVLIYDMVVGQKGQLRVTQRFVAAGQGRGEVNPQAINIVTAAVSGMRVTQRPTAGGLTGRDDARGTQMPIFSDDMSRR
jgi:hypothetical protein